MSPRLTCLMQVWGIERSAPLKCLVGVRREAAGLLKIACDIDIKTQHIEWWQLKFHRVPFGKQGSWACQCEMNNETRPALLIFYLMWNSSLLGLHGSDGGGGLGLHVIQVRSQKKGVKFSFYICMESGVKVKRLWRVFCFYCRLSLLLIPAWWMSKDTFSPSLGWIHWQWHPWGPSKSFHETNTLTESGVWVSLIPMHIRNCSHALPIGIWSVTPQLPSNSCV